MPSPQHSRSPLAWHCIVMGLSILMSGCRDASNQTSERASDVKHQSVTDSPAADMLDAKGIREEFVAIANRLEASENRYLGRGQIDRLKTERSRVENDVGRLVNVDLQLSWNYLRLGRLTEAHAAIDRAFELLASRDLTPQPSLYKLRALVLLRQAEFRNCVQNHNSECCVFPLQGGGIHLDKKPIEECQEQLLQLLKLEPHNLEAKWLLNVASQASGSYPLGVPAAFRIPPSTFASDPLAPPLPRFVDIAPQLGVDALNLCGGVIADDFTGDGRLDIVTSTYDPRGPLLLYRQSDANDLAFERHTMTSQLGGLNCLAADYDGDGDLDILVLRGAWLENDGEIRNTLLNNDGKGSFVDVTREAGLAEVAYPTQAATWGDFDNDGDLDLFVGNESRSAAGQPGYYPSQLFLNDGRGRFKDVAAAAGVTNERYCKGVTAGDYDNDGDLDLYVSNRGPNRLYRNNGDATFSDVAADAGVQEPVGQSFACWFFDFDNDGWLDIFVGAYQASNSDVTASYLGLPHQGKSPRLYRNLANGRFEDVTDRMGLNRAFLPMGANFGDIDNDGFLDIYLTTGRPDFATLTPNVMLRNDNGQRFQDVTTVTGLGHLQKGHGVAFADFDEDGDVDIYHQLGGFFPSDQFHNAFFENQLPDDGSQRHFINIVLHGMQPNTRALGARLRVDIVVDGQKRTIHRAIGSVSSFGGSPGRQFIGLGAATEISSLVVDWPKTATASTHSFDDVPLDAMITLSQKTGQLTIQKRK